MEKIRLHYLIGDVHPGGHDVYRVAENYKRMLDQTEAFDVLAVCDNPSVGDIGFESYFAGDYMEHCEVFVFNCGNYRFNIKAEQKRLEDAVAAGAGFVFLHGDHPCYWKEAGFAPWSEVEKMAGLMWRECTVHGDYADAHIKIRNREHPVMQGMEDFDTRDEIFCRCENVFGVPLDVLATAYSDPEVVSRHGLHGTGRDEPVAVAGTYGKGRTFNYLLGHVWPFYTGHGLGENTMLSFCPEPMQKIFVRACEWTATGTVERTLRFDGKTRLL